MLYTFCSCVRYILYLVVFVDKEIQHVVYSFFIFIFSENCLVYSPVMEVKKNFLLLVVFVDKEPQRSDNNLWGKECESSKSSLHLYVVLIPQVLDLTQSIHMMNIGYLL